jgi:hypothetical protein
MKPGVPVSATFMPGCPLFCYLGRNQSSRTRPEQEVEKRAAHVRSSPDTGAVQLVSAHWFRRAKHASAASVSTNGSAAQKLQLDSHTHLGRLESRCLIRLIVLFVFPCRRTIFRRYPQTALRALAALGAMSGFEALASLVGLPVGRACLVNGLGEVETPPTILARARVGKVADPVGPHALRVLEQLGPVRGALGRCRGAPRDVLLTRFQRRVDRRRVDVDPARPAREEPRRVAR